MKQKWDKNTGNKGHLDNKSSLNTVVPDPCCFVKNPLTYNLQFSKSFLKNTPPGETDFSLKSWLNINHPCEKVSGSDFYFLDIGWTVLNGITDREEFMVGKSYVKLFVFIESNSNVGVEEVVITALKNGVLIPDSGITIIGGSIASQKSEFLSVFEDGDILTLHADSGGSGSLRTKIVFI